jgi:hypothetical protein
MLSRCLRDLGVTWRDVALRGVARRSMSAICPLAMRTRSGNGVSVTSALAVRWAKNRAGGLQHMKTKHRDQQPGIDGFSRWCPWGGLERLWITAFIGPWGGPEGNFVRPWGGPISAFSRPSGGLKESVLSCGCPAGHAAQVLSICAPVTRESRISAGSVTRTAAPFCRPRVRMCRPGRGRIRPACRAPSTSLRTSWPCWACSPLRSDAATSR